MVDSRLPRPVLAAMFDGLSPDAFLAEYYPGRLSSPRPSQLAARLQTVEGLAEPEALLDRLERAPLGPASIALRTGNAHAKVLLPSVSLAREAYRSGQHLTFAGLEHLIPEIAELLAALAIELGIPPGANPRTLLYLSPRGDAAGMHFDANVNFVVQLRGTKRWRYAPNATPAVTRRHVINETQLDPELRLYMDRAPAKAPRARRRLTIDAGQALFLPHSVWHATRALSESMALNFVFGQPTWADFVLDGLRRRLLREPAWRSLRGSPYDRDPSRQAEARASLDALLDGLREELVELDADTLWSEARVAKRGLFLDDRFRRPRGVSLKLRDQVLCVVEDECERVELELGPSFIPLARIVVRAPQGFALSELRDQCPELSLDNLAHALAKLLDAGGLERMRGR